MVNSNVKNNNSNNNYYTHINTTNNYNNLKNIKRPTYFNKSYNNKLMIYRITHWVQVLSPLHSFPVCTGRWRLYNMK